MFTIKTLNAISPVGLAKLNKNLFDVSVGTDAPDGILVRSADMHDAPLPDSLLAIARAGAGTNNIPVEDCTNKGIVVFNTPGANANAVAELVVGALVAGSRNLVDAVNWAQTLKGRDTIAKDVEKGKKAFVGPELRGKTLGVIGLGAIGARVANAAVALGMEVLGYDPYISIDAAWSLSRSVQHCVTLGDMLPRCDYLTIHVPYLPTTRHTINAQTLAMCKDGVRVLNYARGELVDNAALLDALNSDAVTMAFAWHPESTGLDTPFSMTYDGETYYYVTDGNKNVMSLIDAAGTKAAEYVYDPFGRLLSSTGELAEINPFRFSSEYHDDETGLVYYNYRYYSPELGRWISRDPIEEEGGVNLYAMVGNNSQNILD